MKNAGERLKHRVGLFIYEFIQNQQASGFLIIGVALISMLLAHSPLRHQTAHFLHLPLGFQFGSLSFSNTLTHSVNDILMSLFFLMVGLEIKREFISGQLNDFKSAFLPVAAAAGGMIMPAVLYSLFNANSPTSSGWGIPMATDIAFALAVMSFLGNRIPSYLKVFLVSLAVADDLGAILVIAVFYTRELQLNFLLFATAVCVILGIFNYMRVRWIFLYFLAGIFLLYFISKSGIHATLSGVILAAFIPYEQDSELNPSVELAHDLQGLVHFLILPLFAFCNTFIRFNPEHLHISNPLAAGIFAGLIIGKPLGIFGFTWILTRLKLASVPAGINKIHLLGVSVLGGIGFTMSIFISLLSFDDGMLIEEAKGAIILSSLVAAIAGLIILRTTSLASKNQ